MIKKRHFGTLPDGQTVEQYLLTNSNNVSVNILTLGGIIQSWTLPCASKVDIVLGFDTLEEYLADGSYIGTAVGRYANRIAEGKFSFADQNFALSINSSGNTLHGGEDGLHHRVWQANIIQEDNNPCLELGIFSPDGDQGFPGNLQIQLRYRLTDDNCLQITYQAKSDKDTVFNPTQHSYFNLAGHSSGKVEQHLVQVNASHYTPADNLSIPTGEIRSVTDSVFDLRKPKRVGDLLTVDDPELNVTNGLDHNWCLDDYVHNQQNNRRVAIATEPNTNRTLSVYSTMPGIQVYSANFLDEGMPGKQGATYGPNHALCLETQYYPDAPNKPNFPSAKLTKDTLFESVTEYKITF